MAEYTEAFAHFIIECKGAYESLCRRIEAGDVPADTEVTFTIKVPASSVDEIRAERLILSRRNGADDG